MLLAEVIRVSLASLRANPLRSLLTMLGIVIGVAAVIAMTALGNGASRAVQDRITALGTRLLQVDAARQLSGGIAVQNPVRMTEKDAAYLREHNTRLAEIEPQQDRNVQVTYRNQNTSTQVTGAASNFLDVRSYQMDVGRMFTDHEDKARRLYAVLGSDVIEMLNMPSAESVIGDHVRIMGVQFEVIGVLRAKGSHDSFGEPDSQIIIPFETGRFRMFGTPFLTWRGLPLVPSDKLKITEATNGTGKTTVLLMRTGEKKQGVVGLFQPGVPGEVTPSLSVRFMGINRKAIASYLISLYCSSAILTEDALGVLENVEIGHYYEYA